MKNLVNSLWGLLFTVLGAMLVAACDPCAGVVCNNGNCSNGTCVCIDGYEKSGTTCVAINVGYIGSTGSISATVTTTDSNSVAQTTNGVGYTLTASPTDPYTFTLMTFNNTTDNNITFTISSTNYDLIPSNTLTTVAGKTYTVSGAKVGS